MTEKEAIKLLRSIQSPKEDYATVVGAPAFCSGCKYVYPEPEDYAIEEAIKALKEIQQYREIGTVEHFKALKEQFRPHQTDSTSCQYRRCNNCDKYRKENEKYHEIGTVEECREAVGKQNAKKPVCVPKPYNEEVGFNDEWHCPSCGSYIGYFTEGMNEPEQMEYCNECGQHIARDWSEEE